MKIDVITDHDRWVVVLNDGDLLTVHDSGKDVLELVRQYVQDATAYRDGMQVVINLPRTLNASESYGLA